MKCCCAHTELHGSGRDGLAGSHERDCSQAKLGGEWRGMEEASQKKAESSHCFG